MLTRSMESAKEKLLVPFKNPELLFRRVRIQLNMERQPNTKSTDSPSTSTSTFTSTSTMTVNENVEMNQVSNRYVRIFNFLQTILSFTGGIYAIYRIIYTGFINQGERMEVLVLNQWSWGNIFSWKNVEIFFVKVE